MNGFHSGVAGQFHECGPNLLGCGLDVDLSVQLPHESLASCLRILDIVPNLRRQVKGMGWLRPRAIGVDHQ